MMLLANFGKEGRPEPIVAKISQETLAEMIGTTRSRVSHFMNKFRQLGFIEYNGHLEVHSSLLSVVLNEPTSEVRPKLSRRGAHANADTAKVLTMDEARRSTHHLRAVLPPSLNQPNYLR
jgi:DNA-binding IclR family transcriptional regulator